MDKLKKLFNFSDNELKNVSFLHGYIIGMKTTIDELKEENKQLKNKEGIWLSPEDIEHFRKNIDELLTPNTQ